MANGKVTRRAVLTVDLDCKKCRSTGFVLVNVRVGWGPSSHAVPVIKPCECLQAIALPDGALDEVREVSPPPAIGS